MLTSYLTDLVKKCGINLKLGIVQTAYANGASTDYIRNELVICAVCAAINESYYRKQKNQLFFYVEFTESACRLRTNWCKAFTSQSC